jgi:hypothetical protein
LHPLGGTWRDYLWNSWSSGITRAPYLGMLIKGGQNADSERYDVNGVWNTNNVGAWQVSTTDVLEDQYVQTPVDGRSDADIATTDPGYYNNTFPAGLSLQLPDRLVKTNLVEILGLALPSGRLVEDGIKQLSGYPPTLTINGQVSIRTVSRPAGNGFTQTIQSSTTGTPYPGGQIVFRHSHIPH